jgi:hypothetical protein
LIFPSTPRPRLLTLALLVVAVLALACGIAQAHGRNQLRRAHLSRPQISSSPTQVVGELSNSAAARRVPKFGEDRSDNDADNQRVPTSGQLANFRAHDSSMPTQYLDRVDGDYRGTTNQIITWAAYKWGLDPQLLRAVAAVESWWHMSTVGDGGYAYGLFQVDVRYHANKTLAANDSAFNADYYGAIIRSYYDGTQTWLNTVSGNGARYRPHDLWDSVGYWAAGRWDTSSGANYVSQVQSDLAQQVWLQPNFDGR